MLKDSGKESIQVTIRVRPFSQRELNEDSRSCIKLEQANSLQLVTPNDLKKFTFDSICFNQTQEQIFQKLGRKCAMDCLQGYNCTIFAYGQTGAGKTYTMMGLSLQHQLYFEHRGLVPRTLEFLFDCISKQQQNGVNFAIRCSFLQIYNQQIIDLLNKVNTNLQLRQDTRKGVYVQGLTEQYISRSQEAMEILYKGSKSRHVGSTFYNEASSRSHSVFSLHIESKFCKNGVVTTRTRQFHFIDLAGSERTKQSTGERLKEGCNINKSLMNLAAVINSLSQVSEGKSIHVNYRNSKLTFLLKDSLGGNSKTNLIANISPSAIFCQQTLSTLGFARRAKLIKRQRAQINEDSSGNLESMKNQIKRLKQQVLTLVSRTGSEGIALTPSQTASSQMTNIMHQYISEQIDKQTKLQMQILRLSDRISKLQQGIRRYSSSDAHLRLVIAVYEDKLKRLAHTQKIYSQQALQLPSDEEVVEYFKKERVQLIKQIDFMRAQAEGSRFIKELLKQAKLVREDGQDDTLRQLLARNTSFLNEIQQKLYQLKPQRQQIQSNREFQQKILIIQKQQAKKEEQYNQRLEQASLELSEYRARVQENDRLLEDAINNQIQSEVKANQAETVRIELQNKVKNSAEAIKQAQTKLNAYKAQAEQRISQLKQTLDDRNAQIEIQKKQIETIKAKLQKSIENQQALKAECGILEDEKYRAEKQYQQSCQELKDQKNKLAKIELECAKYQQKISVILEENQQLKQHLISTQQLLNQEKKQNKNYNEQVSSQAQQLKSLIKNQSVMQSQLKKYIQRLQVAQKQLLEKEDSLAQVTQRLSSLESDFTNQISVKDQKIAQIMKLISEREESGSETEGKLDQIKVQLINAHQKIQNLEGRNKKAVQEWKDKLAKEKANYQLVQTKLNDLHSRYDDLDSKYKQTTKEKLTLAEGLQKCSISLSQAQEQRLVAKEKEQESAKIKQKEKQQRVQLTQLRSQIFLLQRNNQIETQSLKSQLKQKEAHIERVQKEQTKSKLKYQKTIQEITEELQTEKQLFKTQEESLKKSMETHLLSKQKKIVDLKTLVEEKDQKIRDLEQAKQRLSQQRQEIVEAKNNLSREVQKWRKEFEESSQKIKQLQEQVKETAVGYQQQLEQAENTHNQQLDVKDEQIQAYLIEKEELLKQKSQLMKQKSQLMSTLEKKTNEHQQFEREKQQLTANINALNQQKQTLLKQKQIHLVATDMFNIKQQSLSKQKQQLLQTIDNIRSEKESLQFQLKSKLQYSSLKQENNQQLEATVLKYETQLAKQQSINESLQETADKIEKQLIQAQEQIELLRAAYFAKQSQYNNNFSICATQKTQLETRVQTAEQLSRSHKNKIAELQTQICESKEMLEFKQKQLSSINKANALLSEQLNSNQQQLASNQQSSSEKQSAFDSLQQKYNQFRQQKSTELASLTAQSLKLKQLYQQLRLSDSRKAKSIAELNILNNQLSKAFEAERITVQHLLATNKSLQENIRIIEEDRKLMGMNITSSREESEKISLTIANKNRKIQHLEQQVTETHHKLQQVSSHLQEKTIQAQQIAVFKLKWEGQQQQYEKLKVKAEEERISKQRLFEELCSHKDAVSNLQMLLQNKSAQNSQLELELEQKDNIYRKLVEKIAKNQTDNKRTVNSDHYVKTIELLEKSRAETVELRRANQEQRKVNASLKEAIQERERVSKQIEKKSEGYCISMHKRLEQIQNDYVELERNQQRLLRQKKSLQKSVTDNQNLKEEVRNIRNNATKLTQRHEELQMKLKKANLDYIQLQQQFEDYKRSQITGSSEDKTSYINRLKAEIAALKTQKVLLNETLQKERNEKTKLKSEFRYGKQGLESTLKLELQKKNNQNKNLQEVIFEIVTQLKICVSEPKTKLQVIRSVILGTIRQKNTETKMLKEKLKEYEQELVRFKSSGSRQHKALSAMNRQIEHKQDKEKEGSFLNNGNRQKLRQFENYYARLRQDEKRN